jgi:hypothetical protein
MILYEVDDLERTFKASSQLTSPEAVERSLVVILMFAILWTMGMSIIVCCAIGKWNVHEIPNTKLAKTTEFNNLQNQKGRDKYERIYMKLTEYIRLSFPCEFHDIPFYKRLVVELWNYGLIIIIFPIYPRYIHQKLLTVDFGFKDFKSYLFIRY